MNKLLKLLGFIECYVCKKRVHISQTIQRRFCNDPDGLIGYAETICKNCDKNIGKQRS